VGFTLNAMKAKQSKALIMAQRWQRAVPAVQATAADLR
jgi:hypothetical protein